MKTSRRLGPASFLVSVLVGAALPTLASDGVREINQACATSTAGCFPGDTGASLPGESDGWPVTITQPGSYRLTGNLFVVSNVAGLRVTADDVSIDLGGFEVAGLPGSGAPAIAVLVPPAPALAPRGTSVRNGTIRDPGSSGIDLGDGAHVQDVSVLRATLDGIRVGSDSQIERCVTTNSAGAGIRIGNNGAVIDSVVNGNSYGIVALNDTVIRGSRIDSNRLIGIVGGDGMILTENTVTSNGNPAATSNPGIQIGTGTLSRNDVRQNHGDGINAKYAVVVDNHVEGNARCGAQFEFISGHAAALGGNSFLGDNTSGQCSMPGDTQREVIGHLFATSCNVITCPNGAINLGTFCPTGVTCLP